ncbi:MAG: aminoglycoside phosphotransferase family protein [Phenylobacterium sp.]|uniref:phosphotransferase family protein n=1 Tax=Phenylobacterium sp. TaxID=1871053 RepID=UPI001A583AB1|nr:aminoglycoside phosphotransferase family protein [Phenylobacterium sp.]MBL8554854.1 aminoglycoside phosphotransferase family protein [Phenylobacterium sp.]
MDAIQEIVEALKAGGFLPPDAAPQLHPLAGGVSSDVFRLDLPAGPVCVKRALARLRVAADWRAPVERSHYEVEWLRTAQAFAGRAVPQVLYEDEAANLFVMSFYDPATHSVWKSDLAAGRVDAGLAGAVGRMVAAIHAGAAGDRGVEARFRTTQMFEDLRLAPFLRRCAEVHPDLADRLVPLADRTAAARTTLVHGDVSPKNILHGPDGPVLLDAECAWYGDPAFDLAFCSAHLLLKTVWKPAHRTAYLDAYDALQGGYLPGVDWESPAGLDARAAPLTAAILLARVDGKSPADYLQTEEDKGFVRAVARRLVAQGAPAMAALADVWKEALETR